MFFLLFWAILRSTGGDGLHSSESIEIEKRSVCSGRILTFGIRSIRSPAKVGLVITKLLTTSPVVSWRGWGDLPPPPHTHTHSTTTQLSFFAQKPLSEDLSLRGVLPFVVA